MAEEAYERMVNPEIFGGDRIRPSGHPGGFRGRLQRGQHYEQVRAATRLCVLYQNCEKHLQCVSATCSKSFVKCFLRVPQTKQG